MRKIISLISLLSLLLVINVKADAGPPSFPDIEIEISNKDGAKCYDYDNNVVKTLPYGEHYEANQNIQNENQYNVSINDEYDVCHVDVKDVIAKTDNFKLSDDDKQEFNGTLLTIEKVNIYSGPASIFDKVGTVPKGVKLTPEYSYGYYWFYVNYNGVKGYVSIYKNKIVYKDKTRTIEPFVTTRKTEIYDLSKKVLGYIPANTEINDYWETADAGGEASNYYYIDYNGIVGFVDDGGKESSFPGKCEGTKILTKKSVKVYEDLEYDNNGKITSKEVGATEANKQYDAKYCLLIDNGIYYLTSLKGWIVEDLYEDPYIVETKPDGEVYDHTKKEEDRVILESIEVKGHDINFSKDKKEYTIELNEGEKKLEFAITPDKVKYQELNNSDLREGSTVVLRVTDSEGTSSYTFIIKEKAKAEPQPDQKKDLLDNDQLIMLCVGGGILVAITILVIILLVNKKKKNQVEEVKDNGSKEKEEVKNEENN